MVITDITFTLILESHNMNSMKYKMAPILIFSILVSCHKDIIDNTFDILNSSNDIVWQIPILNDTSECISISPVVYEDGVISSGTKIFSTENSTIVYVDKQTGGKIWNSNDIGFDCRINELYTSSVNYDGIYVGLCSSSVVAFQILNGNQLWSTDYSSGYKLSNLNELIFHTVLSNSPPSNSSSLLSTNINTGIWDSIFKVNIVDGYSPFLYNPGVLIDPNTDTILYFQNRQWNFSTADGKIDLYAYNMSADTILWMHSDIDAEGNSNIRPPVVYNGKVYFEGLHTVYCYDAVSGELLWSKYFSGFGEYLLASNMLVEDNKLIVKTDYESIYALDLETGHEMWSNAHAGATPSDMVYYDGAVYYSSGGDGKIHGVRVSDGKQVFELSSPNRNHAPSYDAIFINPVAIDAATGYLYATDGYYLLCYDLSP